jgi:PRTRC genetic system protein E
LSGPILIIRRLILPDILAIPSTGDHMFTELMPLIQSRPLTITLAPVGEQQIRVNVIPQATEKDKKANNQVGHSHSKEVAAIPEKAIKGLTTPLCLTGTPAEIDAELANTLNKFTSLHVGLQQSFDTAASAIGASVKAIDERERLKKEKDKAGKKPTSPKADEKKPTDEGALPLLWTTQGQNTPAAVSANDAPANGAPPAQAGIGVSNQSAAMTAQVEPGDDRNEEEEEGASGSDHDNEEEEEESR